MKAEKRSAASENRRHLNEVLRASSARYGAYAVLEALCRRAEFDRPEVTITKPQLEIEARRTRNTIKAAIKSLRDEGSIVAIRNRLGGRGNATTYRLCVVGQGASAPASSGAGEADRSAWPVICAKCEAMDARTFTTWIKPLSFGGISEGVLTVIAPNGFIAAQVEKDHMAMLLGIASQADPLISRIRIRADE